MEASPYDDVIATRLRRELQAARASEKRAIDLAEERQQQIFTLQEELDKLRPKPAPQAEKGDTDELPLTWPEPAPNQLRYQ